MRSVGIINIWVTIVANNFSLKSLSLKRTIKKNLCSVLRVIPIFQPAMRFNDYRFFSELFWHLEVSELFWLKKSGVIYPQKIAQEIRDEIMFERGFNGDY